MSTSGPQIYVLVIRFNLICFELIFIFTASRLDIYICFFCGARSLPVVNSMRKLLVAIDLQSITAVPKIQDAVRVEFCYPHGCPCPLNHRAPHENQNWYLYPPNSMPQLLFSHVTCIVNREIIP